MKMLALLHRNWINLKLLIFFTKKCRELTFFCWKVAENRIFSIFGIVLSKCSEFFRESEYTWIFWSFFWQKVKKIDIFGLKSDQWVAYKRRNPQKGGASTRRIPHIMVFLILKVTMSCIQKAEPPKRRCLHKAEFPCYGVFSIEGHDELHTKCGTPKTAVPPEGGAPMLGCF